jgi:hypothetical protein
VLEHPERDRVGRPRYVVDAAEGEVRLDLHGINARKFGAAADAVEWAVARDLLDFRVRRWS